MKEFDNPLLREENARGTQMVNWLRSQWIYICGVGALGSNIAYNLVKMGAWNLVLIDYDRVSRHNISTSVYGINDVGRTKVDALARHIGMNLDIWLGTSILEITESNVGKQLRNAEIVIDALDNNQGRQILADYCDKKSIACLHVGMSADGLYGECYWNHATMKIPKDVAGDPCDVAAARNLVMLTAVTACELIIDNFETGIYRNAQITLRDLTINT